MLFKKNEDWIIKAGAMQCNFRADNKIDLLCTFSTIVRSMIEAGISEQEILDGVQYGLCTDEELARLFKKKMEENMDKINLGLLNLSEKLKEMFEKGDDEDVK